LRQSHAQLDSAAHMLQQARLLCAAHLSQGEPLQISWQRIGLDDISDPSFLATLRARLPPWMLPFVRNRRQAAVSFLTILCVLMCLCCCCVFGCVARGCRDKEPIGAVRFGSLACFCMWMPDDKAYRSVSQESDAEAAAGDVPTATASLIELVPRGGMAVRLNVPSGSSRS